MIRNISIQYPILSRWRNYWHLENSTSMRRCATMSLTNFTVSYRYRKHGHSTLTAISFITIESIGSAVASLIEIPGEEIRRMAADPTSAAVIGLIIRIFSNPNFILGGSELADRLNKHIIGYNETWIDVIYAMAGDRAGSYVLEAMLECCQYELFHEIVSKAVLMKVAEYAQDPVANFVLQALLRRLSFSSQLNPIELSTSLYDELASKADVFQNMIQQRGGVILWLLEVALSHQKSTWIDHIAVSLLRHWLRMGVEISTINTTTTPLQQYLTKVCQQSSSDNNQSLIVRQVGALLRSGKISNVGKQMCLVTCSLPSEVLLAIATNGSLSRVILDPLLDESSSLLDESVMRSLVQWMLPGIPEIANHYVGQHIFRKLYQKSASMELKESIVKAVNGARDKLAQSKVGRASLALVHADFYHRKPEEWKQQIIKQQKASTILLELNQVASTSTGTGSLKADEWTAEDDPSNAKRKRKRKRPTKKSGPGQETSTVDAEAVQIDDKRSKH
jgi:hypothetical protein